eukprot:764046-Hanusia_phi.AAC.15
MLHALSELSPPSCTYAADLLCCRIACPVSSQERMGSRADDPIDVLEAGEEKHVVRVMRHENNRGVLPLRRDFLRYLDTFAFVSQSNS